MADDYLSYLDKLADEYGVPREQARAIFELETRSGKFNQTSPAGARGLMQLMPGTARDMGVQNINDPYQNLRGGVKYYAQQLKAFKDPALAAAAYNAGPGRVQRAGGIPRIRETQNYVTDFRKLIGAPSNVTRAATSATVPQDGELQGTTMDETEQTDSSNTGAPSYESGLAALAEKVAGMPEKRAALREKQFEAAKARLQELYGGPSSTERLWALSRAFLSPKPYKGFAGTLSNVSGAMEGISGRQREADLRREEALFKLQQAYESGALEDEDTALELQYKIAKEQADERAAALKAMEPKYDMDPSSGRYRVRPGTGGAPPLNAKGQYVVRTPVQAASVPQGEPFIYAGDPSGKIYYGR